MKKIVYIFLFFTYAGLLSQTVKITYQAFANVNDYKEQTTDSEIIKSMDAFLAQEFIYDLYYKDGISLFLKEKTNQHDNSENKIIEVGATDQTYKDQKENLYVKQADFFGKDFLITDNLLPFDWILIDEEKKIGPYLCKKAIISSDDTTVEAWYSPDIAIPDGPMDYWGLPGLIVELQYKNLTYKLTSINYKTNYSISKPTKGKVIKKLDFQNMEKEKLQELENGIFNDNY